MDEVFGFSYTSCWALLIWRVEPEAGFKANPKRAEPV